MNVEFIKFVEDIYCIMVLSVKLVEIVFEGKVLKGQNFVNVYSFLDEEEEFVLEN